METIKRHVTMNNFIWETSKPILITFFSFAYALMNDQVLAAIQNIVNTADRFPGYEVLIYFIVKTSGALSAIFGLVYIVYRLWVFHNNKKLE